MTLVQQEALALAITAVTTLGLGLFVYLKNPHQRLNRIFGVYSLSIAWWAAWEAIADVSSVHVHKDIYLFAQRTEHLGVFLVPVLFLDFLGELTHRVDRRVVKGGYGTSLVLALLTLTPLVIKDAAPRHYWPLVVVAGPAYYVGFAWFVGMVTYGLVCLFLAYTLAAGTQRDQLRYLLLGTFIGYVGGTTDFAGSFGLRIPFLNPYGIYGVAIYVAITTYAIVQHRLMDIHVVIRRSLVYSLVVMLLTIGYFGVVYCVERFFQTTMGYQSVTVSLAAFAVMALVFHPLRIGVQRLIDLAIFRVPQHAMAKQLEMMEERAREGERYKTVATLAAGIAHEIKNPLMAIQTFIEFFRQRGDDPDFRQQFHEVVGAEVKRLGQVAQGLMDFSKPQPLALRPLDIRGVVEGVLVLASAELREKAITVRTEFTHEKTVVMGDAAQLKQALLNLILNARDAMLHGGTLTLFTALARGHVEIHVADTGSGIHPKDLPHLFEPFFSKKANGTGLGLSIVQNIIREHRGTISVQSTPGRGTTFAIRLPL